MRGISLKLQEEERERRLDFIPEKYVQTRTRRGGSGAEGMLFATGGALLGGCSCRPLLSPPFFSFRSILDVDQVDIDADTADLLKSIDFGDMGGINVTAQSAASFQRRAGGDRRGPRAGAKQGDRKPRPQKPEAAVAAPVAAQ